MKNIHSFFHGINTGLDQIGAKLEGKRIKINQNIFGSVLFIIFSIVFIYIMPKQIKVTETSTINAQTFPLLLFRIILFCSVFILVKEIVKIILKQKTETIELELIVEIKAVIIFLLFLGYFFLLKYLGFVISSIIYGMAMTFYFRVKKIHYYLIVAFCAVLIGVVFQYILHVRLP